jgi:sulfite reductase (ferredoxin)
MADLARKYGKGRVRATTQQKMVILDVSEGRVENLISELSEAGLQVRASSFRRSTMACTGIEFCKLAVTATKSHAGTIVDELEKRLPDFEDYARINLNGCPNSCARFQIADIGLMGSVAVVGGEPTEVFQVHLGGHLGTENRFGRVAKGARIRADRLTDYIEAMLRLYMARKAPGQDLQAFLNGLDDAALQVFAREAIPAGALVEAGSSEAPVTYAVRPEGDMAVPGGGYKEAADRKRGPKPER